MWRKGILLHYYILFSKSKISKFYIVYLCPFSPLTAVNMNRNRILIRSQDPLHIILIEYTRKLTKWEGSILKKKILEACSCCMKIPTIIRYSMRNVVSLKLFTRSVCPFIIPNFFGSRIPFLIFLGKVDRSFIVIYSWLPGQNWLGFELLSL